MNWKVAKGYLGKKRKRNWTRDVAEPTEHKLIISPTAMAMLKDTDGSIRATIRSKINLLKTSPKERGKPLQDKLQGFYRIVAAGRYRVIYRLSTEGVDLKEFLGKVEIVCLGIRREGSKSDVYSIANRMINSGNLG